MHASGYELDFPLWLRLTHFCNFLLLTLLIRSGIQILSDHPKLYWNDHCFPNSEWFKFGNRELPEGALWTSMDEAVDVSPIVALPGKRHALGVGRHWHFLSVLFWLINGLIYVTLLFATSNWPRLIPTSWEIIPHACKDFLGYLTFHSPPLSDFHPYDPLQQLAYASVIFILTPMTILSGAAMSPAIDGQFPQYTRLFGGQQKARSVHFLCMIGYSIFIVIHVSLVFLVYFGRNVRHITLGTDDANFGAALAIFIGGITFVAVFNIVATVITGNNPRLIQQAGRMILEPTRRAMFKYCENVQHYDEAQISPYFRVNGRPPETEEFLSLQRNDFADYRVVVTGLVKTAKEFSLDDLKRLSYRSQTTKHICIQGWSAIAQWGGVQIMDLLNICELQPGAKRVYFHSHQLDPVGRHYYTSLDLQECAHSTTILAYEMNHEALPLEHGAPLRLRMETKLGFKMCKWIQRIEVVADIDDVGEGFGGYREDFQFYGTEAEI